MKFESVVTGKLLNVTQKPYNFNGNSGVSTKALISFDDITSNTCLEIKIDSNVCEKFLNAKCFEDYTFIIEFGVFGKSINFKLIDLKGGK